MKEEALSQVINRICRICNNELTDFTFEEAQSLRLLRNNYTNIKWHVDHIIPLNDKLITGLHVWNNFAVIPAKDNQRKSNKYEQPD